MKTPIVRLEMAVLLAANVLLMAGCNVGSAETNRPADPLVMQPAPPIPQLPPVDSFSTGAVVTADVPAPSVVPAVDFKPSTNLADVIRLVRAGVNENLLRSFITTTDQPFELGAAGIVYLHDLGMSDEMIDLMLQHDNQTPLAVHQAAPVAPSAQPTPAPEEAVQEEQPAPAPTTVVVEQPAPVTVNYFYETLSPYGTWIELDGYGRCWQPTVVLTQPGWRPYCDNGRWVYSNYGWYWNSSYSWGAAFHYGRWFNHPNRGWCWAADVNWGPAWVTWRASDAYCGWAPLPPQSSWVAGVGLTYRGSAVSVGFNFGYSSDCYTFVPRSQFCSRQPYRYALARPQVNRIIDQTTINNHYTPTGRGGAFNHGFARGNNPAGQRPPNAGRPPGSPSQWGNRPSPTLPAGQAMSPVAGAPVPGQPTSYSSTQRRIRSTDANSPRQHPGNRPTSPLVQSNPHGVARPTANVNPTTTPPVVTQPTTTPQPVVIGRGQNNSWQNRANDGRNFPASRQYGDQRAKVLMNDQPAAQNIPQSSPVPTAIAQPTVTREMQNNPWGRGQNNFNNRSGQNREPSWPKPVESRRQERLQPATAQPVIPQSVASAISQPVMRVQPQPMNVPTSPAGSTPQTWLQSSGSTGNQPRFGDRSMGRQEYGSRR